MAASNLGPSDGAEAFVAGVRFAERALMALSRPVAEVCDLNEHAKYIEFLPAGRDLEAGTQLYTRPCEPFEVAIAGSLWRITPPDADGRPTVVLVQAVYP